MKDMTLETLLLNWFTNTRMNHENNAVLLIASRLVFNTYEMTNLLKQFESPISCRIDALDNFRSFENLRSNITIGHDGEGNEASKSVKNWRNEKK